MERLVAGQLLANRYRLESEIGQGRYSVVWSARDTERDYPVALKILNDSGAGNDARLRAEWQTLRVLNHPHIVRVFDFHDVGPAFYATYLLDGLTLSELGLQDRDAVLPALVLVCRALAYLHARDVAHGDIVASNLMFDSGGAPFLIDFGSARRGDVVIGLGNGTQAALSPERRSGGDPSPADDMYAFGRLLSEVATGKSDFDEAASVGVLDSALAQLIIQLQSPRAERPSADEALLQFQAAGIEARPLPAALLNQGSAALAAERSIVADEIVAVAAPRAAHAASPATTAVKREGVSPRLVWSALAVLLALFAAMMLFLPEREPRVPERTTTTATDAPADAAPQSDESSTADNSDDDEEVLFSEGSGDDSTRTESVRLKNSTDRTLGELLTKQDVLEARAVADWAPTRYATALKDYQAGDAFYLAKEYAAAALEYKKTIAVFDELIGEIDGEFDSARSKAELALEEGDGRAAEKWYRQALAISPGDADSELGLERAVNLDQVLSLTELGKSAESDGAFEAAVLAYDKALAVDAAWEPAVTGRARAGAAVIDQQFNQFMTDG